MSYVVQRVLSFRPCPPGVSQSTATIVKMRMLGHGDPSDSHCWRSPEAMRKTLIRINKLEASKKHKAYVESVYALKPNIEFTLEDISRFLKGDCGPPPTLPSDSKTPRDIPAPVLPSKPSTPAAPKKEPTPTPKPDPKASSSSSSSSSTRKLDTSRVSALGRLLGNK